MNGTCGWFDKGSFNWSEIVNLINLALVAVSEICKCRHPRQGGNVQSGVFRKTAITRNTFASKILAEEIVAAATVETMFTLLHDFHQDQVEV